jgi:myo-inositol-1(or 4)-monophosphatase
VLDGSPPHGPDLALALRAARAAGAELRRRLPEAQSVRFKSPQQPVTAADLAADRILRETLLGARPTYGWLSEETADSPARLARERVWIVDPIDGTTSFLARRPEFVVSVALVERGIPVAGVVYNPMTDETYHAAAGRGAYRNGERIQVTGAPRRGAGPVLLASRDELERGTAPVPGPGWRVRGLGSTAYKMVHVADGSAQAYASRALRYEWDVCGAALVLTEAGGQARQYDGAELSFNRRDPAVRGMVALGGLTGAEREALLASLHHRSPGGDKERA